MKVISFNANGIRATAKKGFYEWLKTENPDIVCLQETKAQIDQLESNPIFFPEGYHCSYFDAQKKGYSGVAIYARKAPDQIIKGFGCEYCDNEGRYLQYDFPKLSVISLYLPSGTSGEGRQAVKYQVLERFTQQLIKLKDSKKQIIICGDFNIAHENRDVKNWRTNQKTSGFLPEERAWLDKLFGPLGYVDAFRVLNQNSDEFTWWSQRRREARANNIGWRIDYQVITPGLIDHLSAVSVFRDIPLADHAPVIMTYQGISL